MKLMLHGAFALWFEAPGPRSGSGRAVMGVGGRGADSIYLSLHISLSHSLSLSHYGLSPLSLVVSLILCVVLSSAFSYFVSLALTLFFICLSFFLHSVSVSHSLSSSLYYLPLSLSLGCPPLTFSLYRHSPPSLWLSLFIFLSLHYHCQSVSLSLTLSFSFCILCLSFLLPSLLCLSLSLVFACPSVLPS